MMLIYGIAAQVNDKDYR
uniref:Uncharacterized protein n=1 Tax=Anguilla anguilla TaxID=7936 RepID=A0A0E9XAB0_ANGAN